MRDVPHIEVKCETTIREITPGRVYYDFCDDEPGWRLSGWDIEKQAIRDYVLADCDFQMNGTLEQAWKAVRKGRAAPDTPGAQTVEQMRLYAERIDDELCELSVATIFRDNGSDMVAEQVGAYVNIIRSALIGLVELGVEPSAIFDIPQSDEIDARILAHVKELMK